MFIIIICVVYSTLLLLRAQTAYRTHNIRLLRVHSLPPRFFCHTLDVLFIVIRLTFHSVRHPSPSPPHFLSYLSSYYSDIIQRYSLLTAAAAFSLASLLRWLSDFIDVTRAAHSFKFRQDGFIKKGGGCASPTAV